MPERLLRRIVNTSQLCSLNFLAKRLHLVTFASQDPLLLSHFVAHYLHVVKVRPEHFHVLFDDSHLPLDPAAPWLARLGLPPSAFRIVNMSNEARLGFDRLKLAAINVEIASLPVDAFAIVPDLDEFFEYPCDVRWLMREKRQNIFCAKMTDRLATSGKIEPLRAAPPSIAQQFPIRCQLRQAVFQKLGGYRHAINKVVLMQVRPYTKARNGTRIRRPPRLMINPHQFSTKPLLNPKGVQPTLYTCQDLGSFAHYTLTLQQYDAIKAKLARWGVSPQLKAQYTDLEAYMAPFVGSNANQSLADQEICRRQVIEEVLDYLPGPQKRCCEQWLVRWHGIKEPSWHAWHDISGVTASTYQQIVKTKAAYRSQKEKNLTVLQLVRSG